MRKEGLARLTAALMAAGDVPGLDLRDPRDAHAILLEVSSCATGRVLCDLFDCQPIKATPDPEVGMRVPGLTQALWSAINMGLLRPLSDTSVVEPTPCAASGWETVSQSLTAEERDLMVTAGHRWAVRSTARNTRASAFASPGSK
ncbi:hypothetical protein JOJ86_007427 [Rhodococcus percolatus]|nr:hypothetical protein [Rhodococcus opacus]MBP2209634.1 hypothetical protein [Rhodococcus opacus]